MTEDRAALFDANPYPVLICDEKLNLLDANPAALELLGAKYLEDVQGQLYAPLLDQKIPPYQPDGRRSYSLQERMQNVMKSDCDTHFETWMLRGNEMFPNDVTVRRITYNGVPAMALFVCEVYRVASVEQTLSYQERMLNAVAECARMLVDLNSDNADEAVERAIRFLMHTIGANRATLYCTDRDDEDMFNLRFWCSYVPSEEDGPSILLRRISLSRDLPEWGKIIKRGEIVNQTMSAMPPRERVTMRALCVHAMLLMPITFKGRLWGAMTFEDCYDERTFTGLEVSIMRTGATLIAFCLSRLEVMASLIYAEKEALASSRAKSFFLANMSHEIRTPINAIIGMANISRNTSDAERKEYCLQKICDASAHLLGIITDILDMSKIEADRMEIAYEDFDLYKTLRKAADIEQFRMSEKNQDFKLYIDDRIPHNLVGDDQRMAQVLTNLLSNAVNFTPKGGQITLSALLEDENDGLCSIRVDVADNGIGISKEQQSRLFNSFHQADNHMSRKFGGTGLGLALSKRIVGLMGGEIWVKSTLGKGSTFSFSVQLQRGEEAVEAVPEEERGADDFTGFRILLAEDNEINREIVLSLLEETNLEIECAGNGREAVSLFAASPGRYGMIFMDLQMPEMDGYEATERIRALDIPRAKAIPIVAMTANVFREDIEHCLAVGMNGHIGKPLDFDEVRAILRRFLLE
ncbi:hypothetical protein FACS1894202_12200 [Clostridia bacterium]|nr:hypothetical protein FACS1894202_12200 [Clostridia bacterium]